MNWKSIVSAILVATTATAQTVHHLPFASQGNAIELAVANSSLVEVSNVRVILTNAPSWLKFLTTEQTLQRIKAGEEHSAVLSFSVDQSAPVGKEQTLTFVIIANEQRWTKEIRVVVSAPETFELFQNYPNPFNPTTMLSYQLPVPGKVTLKVYNLLGQEVATIVDGERKAGYHQEAFDARNLASGVYVYQLSLTGAGDNRTLARKTMLLLK